ncbi:MAG: hypothetical protein NCW75_07065 [Phycisphaera sp.]|nr:MAG: hypothetical protein NCW75_07065 [Phycisphaera sp.]
MPRRADKAQKSFLNQMRHVRDHWAKADPSSFGLSHAQVQRFGREYERALAAHDRVQELRLELARAMTAKRAAIGTLRGTFGGLSSMIDGLARASRDPGVYLKAGIEKPDRKGPLPRPAAPTKLRIKPKTYGELELTFTIDDDGRGNLVYEVRRRRMPLQGETSPWEPVAVTPKRRIVDENVPSGLRSIGYQVRALRTNGKTGEWSDERIFPFGTSASVSRASMSIEAKPANCVAKSA